MCLYRIEVKHNSKFHSKVKTLSPGKYLIALQFHCIYSPVMPYHSAISNSIPITEQKASTPSKDEKHSFDRKFTLQNVCSNNFSQ